VDHEFIERHLVRSRLSAEDVILHLRAEVGGNDAIAKARRWIRDVARGDNLADIAHREGMPERDVRRIARLAFVSPRIITAIMDGTAPAGITATALVGKLSYSLAEQEQSLSIRR
jgi:hypothetical protein